MHPTLRKIGTLLKAAGGPGVVIRPRVPGPTMADTFREAMTSTTKPMPPAPRPVAPAPVTVKNRPMDAAAQFQRQKGLVNAMGAAHFTGAAGGWGRRVPLYQALHQYYGGASGTDAALQRAAEYRKSIGDTRPLTQAVKKDINIVPDLHWGIGGDTGLAARYEPATKSILTGLRSSDAVHTDKAPTKEDLESSLTAAALQRAGYGGTTPGGKFSPDVRLGVALSSLNRLNARAGTPVTNPQEALRAFRDLLDMPVKSETILPGKNMDYLRSLLKRLPATKWKDLAIRAPGYVQAAPKGNQWTGVPS